MRNIRISSPAAAFLIAVTMICPWTASAAEWDQPTHEGPEQQQMLQPGSRLRHRLAPLLKEHVATARALGTEPREVLIPRCLALRESLQNLGRELLLASPEGPTQSHMIRGLESLHHATDACLDHKRFAANYHFQEAARSFIGVFQSLDAQGQ